MARVIVSTNTGEVVLDLTTWGDDSIELRAKVVPAIVRAIEDAFRRDSVIKREFPTET